MCYSGFLGRVLTQQKWNSVCLVFKDQEATSL